MDNIHKTTINIKEDYYNQSIDEIKREINYISNFYHANYMNIELVQVEMYEELIKILSSILIKKMQDKIIPKTENEKTISINYNPIKRGLFSSKLIELNTNYKSSDINALYDRYNNLEPINYEFLDSFTIDVLKQFARNKGIKLNKKMVKDTIIKELLPT